jgi:hypothetical protein
MEPSIGGDWVSYEQHRCALEQAHPDCHPAALCDGSWPECERRTWEAAAQIAETIGQRYAEQDASGTRYPAAETCAAVACAVNIAAAIRAAAERTP